MARRQILRHDVEVRWAMGISVVLVAPLAFGATIRLTPDAGYEPVEAAQPGDEVVFAPGTYRFRLALNTSGVTLRGEDPSQPPRFDYSGADLQSFPGSNAGSFPGRGAWDVSGSDIDIRSIWFVGVENVNAPAAAAIRFTAGDRHRVSDVRIEGCESGVENVAGALVVENGRFHQNRTHLVVFAGGPFTARGNLLTDATQSNYYLAGGDALFEANWMSRSNGFAGLISECAYGCGGTAAVPVERSIVFRGNVFIQGPVQPNETFFFGVLGAGPSVDGTGLTKPNLVTFSHNTFIGGLATPSIGLLINADPAHDTRVRLFGNAWTGFATVWSDASPTPAMLESSGNWVAEGVDAMGLVSTTTGPRAALPSTLRPVQGSSLFSAAATTPAMFAPTFEFAGDESGPPGVRPRTTVKAAGAFETSSLAPDAGSIAPDSGVMDDDAGVASADAGATDAGSAERVPRTFKVGCGAAPAELLSVALLLMLVLRRRARSASGIDEEPKRPRSCSASRSC